MEGKFSGPMSWKEVKFEPLGATISEIPIPSATVEQNGGLDEYIVNRRMRDGQFCY